MHACMHICAFVSVSQVSAMRCVHARIGVYLCTQMWTSTASAYANVSVSQVAAHDMHIPCVCRCPCVHMDHAVRPMIASNVSICEFDLSISLRPSPPQGHLEAPPALRMHNELLAT